MRLRRKIFCLIHAARNICAVTAIRNFAASKETYIILSYVVDKRLDLIQMLQECQTRPCPAVDVLGRQLPLLTMMVAIFCGKLNRNMRRRCGTSVRRKPKPQLSTSEIWE